MRQAMDDMRGADTGARPPTFGGNGATFEGRQWLLDHAPPSTRALACKMHLDPHAQEPEEDSKMVLDEAAVAARERRGSRRQGTAATNANIMEEVDAFVREQVAMFSAELSITRKELDRMRRFEESIGNFVRDQVASVSDEMATSRKELDKMRRLYAGIETRLAKADWNHYADELARACQEVESWREDVERERTNVSAWIKQEVQDALSQKIDGLGSSLQNAVEPKSRHSNQEVIKQEVYDALSQKIDKVLSSSLQKDVQKKGNDTNEDAIKQEVHDALAQKMDIMNSSLQKGVESTCRDSRQEVYDAMSWMIDSLSASVQKETGRVEALCSESKQEVYNALAWKIDNLSSSLQKEKVEMQRVEATCRDLSKRMDESASEVISPQSANSVATQRVDTRNEMIAMRRVETQCQALTTRLDVEIQSWSSYFTDAIRRVENQSQALSSRLDSEITSRSISIQGLTEAIRPLPDALQHVENQSQALADSLERDMASLSKNDERLAEAIRHVETENQALSGKLDGEIESRLDFSQGIIEAMRRVESQSQALAGGSDHQKLRHVETQGQALSNKLDGEIATRMAFNQGLIDAIKRVEAQSKVLAGRLDTESPRRSNGLQGLTDAVQHVETQVQALSEKLDAEIANSSNSNQGLIEAIERIKAQCQTLSNSFIEWLDTEPVSPKSSSPMLSPKRSQPESARGFPDALPSPSLSGPSNVWGRIEEEFQGLLSRFGEVDGNGSTEMVAKSLDDQNAKKLDWQHQHAKLGNAFTGYDVFQELVEKLRTGFKETEVAVQRVSQQCEDVLFFLGRTSISEIDQAGMVQAHAPRGRSLGPKPMIPALKPYAEVDLGGMTE